MFENTKIENAVGPMKPYTFLLKIVSHLNITANIF